ncbi:MAG: enoyl-CoA hydratase/isomerase family protein [Desulfomonile tiedjei]|uniref:Enoyl-CoA hydratase/isomerase family protein n=1 Tax=Desulfomonile tiedjei TaxID=2358 RepID=A0A9D6Z2N7_9BACT|nr:enoyl-CoA hydratase/isomerase family protein [Desulfomonile tiedjei]
MEFVEVSKEENLAVVTVNRGKVNALNEIVVDEVRGCLEELAEDAVIRAVILTGQGRFFSFGFDIPEFLSYSREDFTRYLTKFAGLYEYLFLYPKPVVAALNGHTIAGACMIATACDYRVMVDGKAKISLNEITFGASVFAGAVGMLRACVGHRNAETILCSGSMYSADGALELGLIDKKTTEEKLIEDAMNVARDLGQRDHSAFYSIKKLLRKPIMEKIKPKESDSISEFVDIWYSESTRKQLQDIKIR